MTFIDTAERFSGTSGSIGRGRPAKLSFVMMLTIAGLLSLILVGCYSGSPIKLQLQQPILSFPSNDMKLVPDTLTLTWDSPTWTRAYSVQVSTDIDFSTFVDSAICTLPSLPITLPLVNNTTYYWRVSASDGERTSGWSAIYSFTTGVAAPTLLDPPIMLYGIRKRLLWNGVSLPSDDVLCAGVNRSKLFNGSH